MDKKNCFIAGLPSSGKSTYIAALWWTVTDREDKIYKHEKNMPNTEHLDNLKNAWLGFEDLMRTPGLKEAENISIELTKVEDGSELSLSFPDLKGEKFYNLHYEAEQPALEKIASKADCLFYFMREFEKDVYKEEGEDEKQEPENESEETFSDKKYNKVVSNIIMLKKLKQMLSCDKIIFFISAWDTRSVSNGKSAEEWLKKEYPALYNVIYYNFKEVYILGISAQGGSYNAENLAELQKASDIGMRAYIYEKEKLYDMTYPLTL